MIEKLKFIKLYETFHKDYFDKLIEDDKTYIDKKEYEKSINFNIIDIEKYNIILDKIQKYDISKNVPRRKRKLIMFHKKCR